MIDWVMGLILRSQRKKKALERQEKGWEEFRARPDYFTRERYAEICAADKGEPIHTEYITPEMIDLFQQSYAVQGYITFIGGGWRGVNGEAYIRIGGWTPTIAEDSDPLIFHRKVVAAEAAIKQYRKQYRRQVLEATAEDITQALEGTASI